MKPLSKRRKSRSVEAVHVEFPSNVGDRRGASRQYILQKVRVDLERVVEVLHSSESVRDNVTSCGCNQDGPANPFLVLPPPHPMRHCGNLDLPDRHRGPTNNSTACYPISVVPYVLL